MKKYLKYTLFIIIGFGLSIFSACDKDDKDEEFGYSLIYMPQATFSKVSNTCDYPIPSYSDGSVEQLGNAVANYKVEEAGGDKIISITLGVTRSGLENLEAYSVNVVADNDTIIEAQNMGFYPDAVLAEAETYTLPTTIDVGNGQRDATFNLVFSKNKLLAAPRYAGKQLVLAVKIQNASRYTINEKLGTTIVIVNNWETLE